MIRQEGDIWHGGGAPGEIFWVAVRPLRASRSSRVSGASAHIVSGASVACIAKWHPMSSLVICDVERLFTEALTAILEANDFTVVGVAITLEQAVAMVARECPDICIVDLSFPGANPGSAIEQLLQQSPTTRVVVLCAALQENLLPAAIVAGAQGYAMKDASVGEMVSMLRTVADGQVAIPALVLRSAIALSRTGDSRDLLVSSLTFREREVLLLLAEGHDTSGLALALRVSIPTARTHVQNVLTKLGAHSRLQAVAFASANGLLQPGRLQPSLLNAERRG